MPAATEAEASGWGLTLEEATATVDVWPDNVQAFNTFTASLTQWRMGMNGPVGLDYSALPTILRFTQVPRADWPAVFDDLRVMEDAALSQMRENQKAK